MRLLGQHLRRIRREKKVTESALAEAAGVSRATLNRIEQGETGVAIGSWTAVAAALGLTLELSAATDRDQVPGSSLEAIRLADYPQLSKLAWHLHGVEAITPAEALQLYEGNWRHVDKDLLTLREVGLIDQLSRVLGGGRLLV